MCVAEGIAVAVGAVGVAVVAGVVVAVGVAVVVGVVVAVGVAVAVGAEGVYEAVCVVAGVAGSSSLLVYANCVNLRF